MIREGMFVYPVSPQLDKDVADSSGWGSRGMTLREYYAGLAMQGFVSANDYQHVMLGRDYQLDDFAAASVRIADALIAALEKTND